MSSAIKKHEVTYFLLNALNIFQHLMCVRVFRCWALALFGGNSETGFDQNTTYSIFSISITLTDEGFQNFYQVKEISCFLSSSGYTDTLQLLPEQKPETSISFTHSSSVGSVSSKISLSDHRDTVFFLDVSRYGADSEMLTCLLVCSAETGNSVS